MGLCFRGCRISSRASLWLSIVCALVLAPGLILGAEQVRTNVPSGKQVQPSPVRTAKTPAAKARPAKRQLSGAELYSIHCNRCHPERYPTERTAAQWKTILLHMRVRANLPASQARTILQYLQDNSGR